MVVLGFIIVNENCFGKIFWMDCNDGEKFSVWGVWDDEEEVCVVCDDVEVY